MTYTAFDPATVVKIHGAERNALIVAYRALNIIGGQVLLPIVIATFFARRGTAHPLLINMCITWSLSALVSCLTFYAQTESGPFCILQASLIWAAACMCATSVLAFTYYVWKSLQAIVHPTIQTSITRIHVILLIFAPYVALLGFGTAGAIVALTTPRDQVSTFRRIVYCAVPSGKYPAITSAFVAILLIMAAYFSARMGHLLWTAGTVNYEKESSEAKRPGLLEPIDRQIIWRVFAFSALEFVGLALSCAALIRTTVIPDMVQAATSIIIALIFGTQPRVLTAWRSLLCCGGRQRSPARLPLEAGSIESRDK